MHTSSQSLHSVVLDHPLPTTKHTHQTLLHTTSKAMQCALLVPCSKTCLPPVYTLNSRHHTVVKTHCNPFPCTKLSGPVWCQHKLSHTPGD